MGQAKVYKRVTVDGEDYLLLSDRDILSELDLSWAETDDDIKEVLRQLHEYESIAEKWFWIETGVPIRVEKRSTGFTWVVSDRRENSMKYKWLKNKVAKFENRIIATINKYNKDMKEVLRGEVDDVEASTGQSD